MKKPELLAPAGDFVSFMAAIEAGCDAIYLGGKSFGARAYSNNFTNEEIVKAINIAHKYGIKVYVTCNTLIFDEEITEFMNYIDFLHRSNVDAVLIQDLGMLDLVRKTYPNLEIHASTQMHIHNLDGVELMQKLGVKRVVIARETSYETIKEIKEKCHMPIEVFIHGALCISYSGQCLMSYLNGGRSGNRGECAGTCRLPYKVLDGNKVLNVDNNYPLSTKDLNSLANIGQLIDIGVDSLKIEGRMKSPAYVYLVVSLYREAIDSYIKTGKVEIDSQKLHDLMIIFNRGYTKGFLFNENNHDFIDMSNSNHQGLIVGKVIDYKKRFVTIKLTDDLFIGDGLRIIGSSEVGVKLNDFYINYKLVKVARCGDIVSFETRSPVSIGDDVLKTSSQHISDNIQAFVKEHARKVNIIINIKAKIGEKLFFEVTDGINKIKKESIILDKANKIATTKDILIEHTQKLGDTIYHAEKIDIEIDNDVFVPLKVFNDLRRDVINKLDNIRAGISNYQKEIYQIDLKDYPKTKLVNALVGSQTIYDKLDITQYNEIYSMDDIENTVKRLLPVMNDYENITSPVLINDIGALNKLSNVLSDTHLNIVNSYGVAFLHSLGVEKITLSYELDYDHIRRLIRDYESIFNKHPNVEVVVYGRIEMMISKFSLNDYYNKSNLVLKSIQNSEYPVKTINNLMIVYSSKVNKLTDDYFAIGVNAIRKDYLLEKDTL